MSNDWTTPPWEEDDGAGAAGPADAQTSSEGAAQLQGEATPADQPGDWFSVSMNSAVSGNESDKTGGRPAILLKQGGLPSDPPAPVQSLDALRLPLSGTRLIEASAGTGKTYTIAQLYLRLVLGHGPEREVDGRVKPTAFARALTPPEILVVTFTDAATNELRDRIRQRLGEAANVFEAGVAEQTGDAPQADFSPPADLLALRDDFAPGDWAGCAKLLRVAADWMDEAAVSTIHSWCYRMLREHAFDSGNLFTQTLLTDEAELQLQAAQDYWRQQFYGLTGPQSTMLTRVKLGDPETLMAAVRPLMGQESAPWTFGDELLDPTESPVAQLVQVSRQTQHAERLQNEARAAWAASVDALEAQFRKWLPVLDGRRYAKADRMLDAWLLDLRRWSEGGDAPLSKGGRKHIKYFGLQEIKLKGVSPPAHPAFVAIDAWLAVADGEDTHADLARFKAQLVAHATWHIRRALAAEKLRRAELGFDDVLRRLHAALTARHGTVLAERIRRQFPVAMIDEFQDTDPIQWAMFDAVYRVSSEQKLAVGLDTDAPSQPDDASSLLLIGDPKQAIYGFRGADIHTYLQARRATAGRHYSLGTNFRSTQALVGAVNAVFDNAESNWPEAAFRFAHRFMDGQADNPMPFLPVAAKGRAEQLLLDGRKAPALTWWWLAPEGGQDAVRMTRYRRDMAQACATQMADWLRASAGGNTGFLQPSGAVTPLRPRDMAVLVRDRKEADAIRQALAARGIASAYLSERESVFESPEAQDLSVWLEAVHSNAQASRLRAALGTASMGRSHAWLERLNHDELLWDEMVLRFRGYGTLWREQGVLPMVRQLLHDFALPSAWLSLPGGARTLTNLLHLAEWLQTQAQQLDSPQALMRELSQQIENPGQGQDGARLRLESDDDLIKVVTIHKSKGLEYPLVLLPFIGSWRGGKAHNAMVLPAEDESGARRVNLDVSDDDDQALAQLEQQREDLRLLYVALTRARHAVWLGVAPLASGNGSSCQVHDSALGYLLGGTGERSAALYRLQVSQLCTQHPSTMRLEDAPTPRANRWQADAGSAQHIVTRAAPPRRWQPWWIASYSAITSNLMDEDGASLVGSEAAPSALRAPQLPLPQTAPHIEPEHPANDISYELSLAEHLSAELLDGQAPDEPAAPRAEVSQLLLPAHGADADEGNGTEGVMEEGDDEAQAWDNWDDTEPPAWSPARPGAGAQGIHAFARGAEVGIFWHELLQLAALQGFVRMHDEPEKLGELVARRARVRGWGEHAPAITAWLLDWLRAPMPLMGSATLSPAVLAQAAAQQAELAQQLQAAQAEFGASALPDEKYADEAQENLAVKFDTPSPIGPRLIDLQPSQLRAELEFWLPVHEAAVPRIDALVRAHIEPGRPRPQLAYMQLRGMLKGFMDLVFQAPPTVSETGEAVPGRFHVLDYKSNWLGTGDASYHPEAVRDAALASRYDLQAALYLLALHRLLRSRLADYQPERHLGSSLTWFLRGTARPGGSVWACTAPVPLLNALDALFDGGHA